MTNILSVTLAALVGLAASFHSGVEQLNSQNYDKAIAAFTTVIQAEPSVTDMRNLSLLHRAEAYVGLGNKVAAMQDVTNLLQSTSDVNLRRRAVALYTAQGGVLRDLRPKESPQLAFDRFMMLIKSNDYPAARQQISGALLKTMEMFDTVATATGRGRSVLAGFGRNAEQYVCLRESFDDTNQTASLAISYYNGQIIATFGLVRQGERWTADKLENYEYAGMERGMLQRQGTRNMTNLRLISQAIRQQAAASNATNFPARLEDFKPYITGNNADFHLYIDAATGKQMPFIYCAGLPTAGSSERMVVATPVATDGCRYVLLLNGSVQTLSEEEFVNKAKEQKWVISALINKEDVEKDVAAEVADLIRKLGDADSKVRAAARKRLREIGAPAAPFLREQEKHTDPEIQEAVRELLKMN